VTLTKVAGISTSATQTLVNGMTYQDSSQDPTSGTRTITLTQIKDSGGVANGGVDTTGLALAATVTVTPVNDAPTLTASGTNPTFTEGSGQGVQASPVNVFSGAATSTVEAGQTITSLTFTVSGLLDGASETIVVDGTTITLGSTSSGTTTTNGMSYTSTVSAGTATVVLTKAGGVSTSNINSLVNGITYQDTNIDNPSSGARVFTLTQVKDSGGTTSGGVDTSALSIASTVTVVPLNDAPTLTATATNPTFQEAAGLGTQASAVNVFSGASVGTIESGQTITSLTFTVSGLADGASERIVVDGTTITLGSSSSGTTTTNGMTYNVTVSSGTATVVLTKVAGVSTANVNSLVNGITYQDINTDNPTAGARVFTLTQIKDSGGTANGGVDTASLSIASTVTVVAVNDAPTLSGTAVGGTFTEGAGASTGTPVSLFSGSSVSTIESGQTITSLTFTGVTVTVAASAKPVVSAPPFATPPLSLICVSVTVRVPEVGSWLVS